MANFSRAVLAGADFSHANFCSRIRRPTLWAPVGCCNCCLKLNPWNSVISFHPGIPVSLGGMLDLEFTSDVEIGAQLGRTIHLFDWSGVSPSGAFTIGGPYTLDVSQLYTAGEVTLTAVPEPATAFTAAFGFAVVGGVAISRRRQRRGGCRF
jgi:hypothetical protein